MVIKIKIKSIFFITLFLLCLMIGAASAANNDTVVSSDVVDDTYAVLAQEDTEAVSNSDDEAVLKEDNGETSFEVLNEGNDSEIDVGNDSYDGSSDSELSDGIVINETLNFEGRTINGNSQTIIFNIVSGGNVTITNLNIINGNSYQANGVAEDTVNMGNLTDLMNSNQLIDYFFKFIDSYGDKLMDGLSEIKNKISNLTSQLGNTQSIAKKLAEQLDVMDQLIDNLHNLVDNNNSELIGDLVDAKQKIGDISAYLNNTQTIAMKLIEQLNAANQKADNMAVDFFKSANIADLFNMTAKSNTVNGNSQELIFNITSPEAVIIENLNLINGNAHQSSNQTDVDNLAGELSDVQANATRLAEGLADANKSMGDLTRQIAEALTYSAKSDDKNNAAPAASSKSTATKMKTTVKASNKVFKAKAKSKKIKIKIKAVDQNGKKTYLKSGKVTLKVKGKTYTAKISKKGVAKFTIKLTKKGKYTAKIKFAGDKTYKESSKKIKIKIK